MTFNLRHIYKSFAPLSILEDANLSINHGDIIALIGENGAGKTTLLRILRGDLDPDAGSIQASGIIGYVPQEAGLKSTVRENFSAIAQPWQIDYALKQVGLDIKELDTPASTLSGGQKTRLALAAVLTQDPKPALLLLDEPTNNLDAEGLIWLEDFICSFDGAVILVSHDRQFINNTATKIADLRKGKIKLYSGDYEFYRQQKEREDAASMARYQQNIKERNHLIRAIRDQRVKGKHTHEHMRKRSDHDTAQRNFFKNRVTKKFGQQTRALEKRLEQIDDVKHPEFSKDYAISLGGDINSSKLVVRVDELSKAYSSPVLNKVDLEIRGGERIHVQGSNGSGKTTLLKIIAGRSKADSGELTYGNGISIGYLSQDVDGLDHHITGLQNLIKTEVQVTSIFRTARSVGLSDTDLKKPVSELSRGQQAKLSFAKLLLGSHQLLVLDEPTNHLDIPTREQIESALQLYRGAILFASHDNYFVKKLQPSKELNLLR